MFSLIDVWTAVHEKKKNYLIKNQTFKIQHICKQASFYCFFGLDFVLIKFYFFIFAFKQLYYLSSLKKDCQKS